MIVICLHHVKHLIIGAGGFTKAAAILATVLLDHTRLKFHRLLETSCKLCFIVVGQCVLKTNVHLGNLAESVLGTHLFHHIRRWPDLNSQLPHLPHAVIKLLLATSIIVNLSWIASYNDRIELLHDLEELVVFCVEVVDKLAAHSCRDHSICEWDGVVAVTIAALVSATIGLILDVDLSKTDLELWAGGLIFQAKVVFGDSGQRGDVHRPS